MKKRNLFEELKQGLTEAIEFSKGNKTKAVVHKIEISEKEQRIKPNLYEVKSKRLYETYGINMFEYNAMYKERKGKCDLCLRYYATLNVDHRHVLKYKKLPPEQKKNEVRGLLCMRCNKFSLGGLEIHKNAREILYRMVAYSLVHKLKGDL